MVTQIPMNTKMKRYSSYSGEGVLAAVTALREYDGPNLFPGLMGLSLLAHLLTIGLLALLLFLLQFFGLRIPLFEPPPLQGRDIEFTLVENPTEKPRNPHTLLRSTHATRAGGQKNPRLHQSETIRLAGNPSHHHTAPAPSAQHTAPAPSAQPSPTRPAARPQPAQRPTPKATNHPAQAHRASHQAQRNQQPPSPQPPKPAAMPHPPKPTEKQQTPAPPAPPKAPISKVPNTDVPSPVAPKIRIPSAPQAAAPRAISTGPVAPTYIPPSGGSRSGSRSDDGPEGPSQIPGALSGSNGSPGAAGNPGRWGARGGRPGAVGGGGGRGSYEQYGSPGGGGGRAGVDALPAPDYGAYMAELQRRIKRNWHPPTAQEDKRVVVNFSIDRSGRLLGVTVTHSSGFSEADQAALAAVRLSAPFRPLPLGHKDNDLAIQFTFDYNVYRGGLGGFNYR